MIFIFIFSLDSFEDSNCYLFFMNRKKGVVAIVWIYICYHHYYSTETKMISSFSFLVSLYISFISPFFFFYFILYASIDTYTILIDCYTNSSPFFDFSLGKNFLFVIFFWEKIFLHGLLIHIMLLLLSLAHFSINGFYHHHHHHILLSICLCVRVFL